VIANETTLTGRATAYLATPRGSRWLLALFIVAFLLGMLGRDVRRPLWHDELFTQYVASASVKDGLWNVLSTGVDLNPPVYYLCVRATAALLGYGSVSTRLPSTLGFLMASLALYIFMRRRVHPWFAIVAALSLPMTAAVIYAYEGRPYGLLLGLSAVALAAWQWRSQHVRHPAPPIVCALALAAAVFTHFYAVLMVLPLAAGEATRVFMRRRIDWGMWIALGLAVGVPLLLLRPLVSAARQFAATFWSPPTLETLSTFYRELPDPLGQLLIVSVGCVAIALVMWPADRTPLTSATDRPRHGLHADEIVATLTMAVLPLVGFVVAFKTGAFHGRYVVQAVLALGIFVGWGFASLIRRRRDAAIFLGSLCLVFLGRMAVGAVGLITGPVNPVDALEPLLSKTRADVPLVASHVLDFLPLAHYGDEGLRKRLVYLMEPPPDPRYGLKTADRAMRLLANEAPLRVEDLETFVRSHGHFYVYGRGSFLVPILNSRGASVRILGATEDTALYEVDLLR
jgi:hypothetical protein